MNQIRHRYLCFFDSYIRTKFVIRKELRRSQCVSFYFQ